MDTAMNRNAQLVLRLVRRDLQDFVRARWRAGGPLDSPFLNPADAPEEFLRKVVDHLCRRQSQLRIGSSMGPQ